MSKILIDRAVVEQALDFCEFAWRDVLMNEYAFKRLEQMIATLRASLAEQPAEQEAVAPQQQQQQLKRTHPLDVPLEVFLADLTTRPANVIRLELTGLFDGEPLAVRHLCMFSRKEMKRWPNFGKKCLNEVEELLRARGLRLWESHDERSLRLLHEHKEYFL